MARPRIAVLGDYERALTRLADWSAIQAQADVVFHHAPLRGDALAAVLREAEVLVLVRDRTPLDAATLQQAERLRYVVFTGTRNTTLDVEALRARGIPVANTEWGPSKESTCEMTWALILAATRQLEMQMATMRRGGWRPAEALPLPGVLHGERLGLIGLGEIGKRVARVGKALGMEVVTWSPRMTPERAAAEGVTAVSLEALLSTSRVVSLHLVPTAETTRLINAERLALMRADALLVNTSRSALIDMEALPRALDRHRPAMAALDVFDEEPVPADYPLRGRTDVVVTPHVGFVSEPVFTMFAKGVVGTLGSWLEGQGRS
ncbi:Hydroxypyruvate reductase [Cupriavidus campinensis]|uniref:D-2-hydroxyacid dehydrogenase family protein n=1 Tax=Cupriavidus campinensis TaxID=151783 RepID=A0AAE9IA42_9BURK|nr:MULTISPECIES: D-2-hydroxyacid dehydrogenase family protein [Cupriavidus]TSP12694.1 D-2-hydroxyacid dehydrogenase family protein [Cupriavidus campinensis]URF06891.1 D-2-hydroxyacid dehydrogenase family protein [Cupriavidus campinensis]CAG2156329.1 Hydroxypyruvate reductase [Cupriavidus campinensis]